MRLKSFAIFTLALVAAPLDATDPSIPVPLGNPGEWVTSNDYPASALREDREGVVRFTLAIDSTGAPIDCTITQSSGNEALDEATCRLVKERSRFAPATDRAGEAVAGTWSSAVRWEIPRGPRVPPPTMDWTIAFVVEKDGSVTGCTVEQHGDFTPGNDPCEAFSATIYASPTDDAGNPVRRRITFHNTVTNEIVGD